MKVTMACADFGLKEKEFVNEVLDSGWLSRHQYIPAFEERMAQEHQAKYALMTNSGTDALRIALASLKEMHRWKDGSRVLVPAVTFSATVNIVLQNNLEPVFVDVDPITFNLDTGKALTVKGAVGVIPVHLFGLPCNLSSLLNRDWAILEDSCESIGCSKIQGNAACYSFYMAHPIQTGVGGMILTNNKRIWELSASFQNHGRNLHSTKYEYERIGYSSRPTEMEAALGCAQMERLDQILFVRRGVAGRYLEHLKDLPVQMDQRALNGIPHAFMFFPLVLLKGNRDKLMRHLLSRGVESRPMMPLINQVPYRKYAKPGQFPVAEWINKNGICLPCHQKMTKEDVDHVIASVRSFFK